MNNIDKKMKDITILDFKALKISLASREEILSWSYGEVTKPETINYRTLRPEKDGLFDERIFGPTKDWECYCGKYKRVRYRGIVCDKCGVEVTLSRVRRERMGHITLASPVAHVWFFKSSSSPISLILDMPQKNLESVIYYASYLIIDIDEDKKEEAIKVFNQNVEKRRKRQKEEKALGEKRVNEEIKIKKKEMQASKVEPEQKELIEQELELERRQKIAAVTLRFEEESKKQDEVFDVFLNLLKSLKVGAVFSEDEYFKILEYDIPIFFTYKTGGEGILDLLEKIDLPSLIIKLRKQIEKAKGQKYLKLIKRLRLIEAMRRARVQPSFMLLSVLPVIPPDLRPMVQLSGGRFATSDLNDLYRRVINRNNRLKHLMSLGAPGIILKNERRMLQEGVDSLIDISQRTNQVVASPLRSLSDMLRGKQGRFRQNLLGKRVDYSGRSVIVVGPQLNLSQCGLPKEMALEMFKPFVLREIILRGFATNIKSAKRFIDKGPPEVFDILEEITKNHPVLLNRAPTLHKLSIQAFYPILIEGLAIALHPCVCAGYNADFDGDQMAVHIPLSKRAQEEALNLMMPKHNLLKPADGSVITLPNKEMAVGIYYLTTTDESQRKEEPLVFKDIQDAILAHSLKIVTLREPIQVRINNKIIETTIGRIFFNEHLPESFDFVNYSINATGIKRIITQAIAVSKPDETQALIDSIKSLGFYGATISGISVSVFDNEMIKERERFIRGAEKKVAEIEADYQKGLITIDEKKRLSNDVWLKIADKIADLTWDNLKDTNVIKVIIDSEGARAGKEQLKQLSAMKGLILDPLGKIVELPIKSNFREGLSIFEYVASARGSRKGLTDSALKTANAGYLTRRLVDASHDVIVREEDCGGKEGILIRKDEAEIMTPFVSRILGRVVAENVVSKKTKKVILNSREVITEEKAKQIADNDVNEIVVRSPITCRLKYGICTDCYGWDFSTRKIVEVGVPVGVIAAQSIGEPGTQLTMRVRHFGGVVMSDVTQGLPRVEELFEMRTPKNLSPISEVHGRVKIETTDDGYILRIKGAKAQEREYFIPKTSKLSVMDGEEVRTGAQLAVGYLDPKEILRILGLTDAQRYIITEAQKVYESQGITINDKHFEVVLRKMSDKVVVETVGDTSLIPGAFVTKTKFGEINQDVISQGGEPSTARQTILGITKSALFSDSWLSAASFQETTKVLTEAALEGREDKLVGLKENVIIGRLIPVEGRQQDEV
ncbi:MAG: DNA-directed RNA polymerase subunit beta' [Patescibacteria group bacterium]